MLCSQHFDQTCFEADCLLVGLSKEPDAIPTLFPRAGAGSWCSSNSSILLGRERVKQVIALVHHVKRARTAFQKRERQV